MDTREYNKIKEHSGPEDKELKEAPVFEAASKEQFEAEKKYFEILRPENEIEKRILRDSEWQEGADWGVERPGHPEGKNLYHIFEVLYNIDKQGGIMPEEREQLRFIALVHDTFKYQVDESAPKIGENHHGAFAARFAKRYTNNEAVLKIIRLHDEAYNAWREGNKYGDWKGAERRLRNFITELGRKNFHLFRVFYQCDNETGAKEQDSVEWFMKRVRGL